MTTDATILAALRACPDGVSGADLAEQMGISRAAVWSRIEELRRLNYEIEAGPHFGYRLLFSPDVLHADDLLARLGSARVIGRDIRVFEETTSTNDVVERLARDGVKEGVAVYAESQTKGRGRLGRKWVSPSHKGLWFSILLRPQLRPQMATQLTVASATALRRAIVLTEMSAELDQVKYIILGIGVDVNLAANEFPPDLRKIATSLRIETGRPVSRAELAVHILRELDRDYTKICAGEFTSVADEWEAHCTTLGREVTVHLGARQIRGCVESLDDDGALLLRSEHGHLERIIGGDVTLEK